MYKLLHETWWIDGFKPKLRLYSDNLNRFYEEIDFKSDTYLFIKQNSEKSADIASPTKLCTIHIWLLWCVNSVGLKYNNVLYA